MHGRHPIPSLLQVSPKCAGYVTVIIDHQNLRSHANIDYTVPRRVPVIAVHVTLGPAHCIPYPLDRGRLGWG